jgi:hypothetical protein
MTDIENLPLKKIDRMDQEVFVHRITKILDIKRNDPTADINTLEQEIDQLVYKLYGFTEEEIMIIEQSF